MNIVTLEKSSCLPEFAMWQLPQVLEGDFVALLPGLFSWRTQESALTNDGSPAATVWSSLNQVKEALPELLRTAY